MNGGGTDDDNQIAVGVGVRALHYCDAMHPILHTALAITPFIVLSQSTLAVTIISRSDRAPPRACTIENRAL